MDSGITGSPGTDNELVYISVRVFIERSLDMSKGALKCRASEVLHELSTLLAGPTGHWTWADRMWASTRRTPVVSGRGRRGTVRRAPPSETHSQSDDRFPAQLLIPETGPGLIPHVRVVPED